MWLFLMVLDCYDILSRRQCSVYRTSRLLIPGNAHLCFIALLAFDIVSISRRKLPRLLPLRLLFSCLRASYGFFSTIKGEIWRRGGTIVSAVPGLLWLLASAVRHKSERELL
ncbi:hypothetical protein Zmor_008243 [Zophobas morio]|uniref:Uncharacterized protein n=1 Tax=Zophobas morio TaxID=2755281 RepID=A0AA38IV60_9CUCU|nr:hypothetical protein Zmor_008243 [Zophobas morio]